MQSAKYQGVDYWAELRLLTRAHKSKNHLHGLGFTLLLRNPPYYQCVKEFLSLCSITCIGTAMMLFSSGPEYLDTTPIILFP